MSTLKKTNVSVCFSTAPLHPSKKLYYLQPFLHQVQNSKRHVLSSARSPELYKHSTGTIYINSKEEKPKVIVLMAFKIKESNNEDPNRYKNNMKKKK